MLSLGLRRDEWIVLKDSNTGEIIARICKTKNRDERNIGFDIPDHIEVYREPIKETILSGR